jgi:sulfate transport system substrate-binding protein
MMLIEALFELIKTSELLDLAWSFIRFTRTPQAQRIFAQYGFRPLLPSVYQEFVKQYPKRPGVFKISDKYIGGWKAVDKRWFDPDHGLWVGIAKRTGVGT